MIYAVEDDRNIRELIVYALRQSGFEAEGFEDGSRLMELPAPELVILDIMLPGEDGLSIFRRLRADPVRKRVPVILLTALSGEENRVALFDTVTFAADMGNAYQNCTVDIDIEAQAVQVKNNPIPAGGTVLDVQGWPAAA